MIRPNRFALLIPQTNAVLRVRFNEWIPLFIPRAKEGNYFKVWLARDYSAAAVGTTDRKFLWILARETILSHNIYGGDFEIRPEPRLPRGQFHRGCGSASLTLQAAPLFNSKRWLTLRLPARLPSTAGSAR